MKKPILFEFEDLPWFPNMIRESMTDYLRYFLTITHFYKPIVPLLKECLEQTQTHHIIDLCSGSGGPIETLDKTIHNTMQQDVRFTLTDRFPNISSYKHLEKKTNGRITFIDTPVDATTVPAQLRGMRTVFSGIHHLNEHTVEAVIRDAVKHRAAIGIFDGGDRNLFTILGIIFFHPIAFVLFTPLFRPFRISRFIFTYLIPLIPICTVWDGVVSILRLYSPDELLRIARLADSENYIWKAGKKRNQFGMNVAYLIGYPITNA
jgi:hypothetical protein